MQLPPAAVEWGRPVEHAGPSAAPVQGCGRGQPTGGPGVPRLHRQVHADRHGHQGGQGGEP